jgi:imidazolonepropionase-like amidohydrolase
MRMALVGGTVLDGTGALRQSRATVVVNDGQIAEVTDAREFSSDVQIIDVSGCTVMPGVIDAHVHLAAWAQWLISQQHQSLMYLAARTVSAMRETLAHGITTARDLGGLEAGFVRAQEQGLLVGPRLQSSVVIIQATNGVTDNIPGMGGTTSPQGLSTTVPGMPLPYVSGPWAARQKVREALRAGADVIKLASTGLSLKGVPQRDLPTLTTQEIEAIVDEAHSAGVMVTCHAGGGPGVLRAVQAGVDTIEHGNVLDEETAEEMAKRGTWLVPMFWILNYHATTAPTEERRARYRVISKLAIDAFQLARRKGVRIAMGSDSGEHGIGGSMVEIELMVKAGMTPAEAIVASTRQASECLRIDDRVGTLEPGKEADLIVVRGDPLQDISVLQQQERLELVLQAGKPVAGTRLAEPLARLRPNAAAVPRPEPALA